MYDDHDRCYGIVRSRDRRFDGCFLTAVRTTGIYCRPSCPARTPHASNVEFFPTTAAAQAAGFRACKRCRPDASPGSPEWLPRSDVVARAVRLIADGVVDREGVPGLAARLGYSDRQLHRVLVAELGASALALARSQRAQNARILIESTAMPMVDVAFAAGFSSLRQFNDTVRQVFDATPTELRAAVSTRDDVGGSSTSAATISLRLAHRSPISALPLWDFLGHRCLAGVEEYAAAGSGPPVYRRILDLPRGHGLVDLRPADGHVVAVVRLEDVRDLTAAVARCRRLLDLDADPVAVDERLAADPVLARFVHARPGLRSPGAVDGFEIAVRAVLGQQVSVVASLRSVGALVDRLGGRSTVTADGLDRTFPAPEAVAAIDPTTLRMPRRRSEALVHLAARVADGTVSLGPGADRADTRAALLALPGIGPWTADYISLRALGDPDVLVPGDLVVRQRAERLGIAPSRLVEHSRRWAPWRSTVVHHLWAARPEEMP